jgi:hypothetical protein
MSRRERICQPEKTQKRQISQSEIQETVRLKKVLEESFGGNVAFAVEAAGKGPDEVGLSGRTLTSTLGGGGIFV